jgi:hypothetical protein
MIEHVPVAEANDKIPDADDRLVCHGSHINRCKENGKETVEDDNEEDRFDHR